jgi:hypothetical protein
MSISTRLKADYLRPDRIGAYGDVLRFARSSGYRLENVRDGFRSIVADGPDQNILLVRIDVDSDAGGALKMWEEIKSIGASATFYFRLATFDAALARRIEAEGGEATYHYEELSTLMFDKKILTTEQAKAHAPEAFQQLRTNLERLRNQADLPMVTIAAHGDWLNRRLKVSNAVLMEEPNALEILGLEVETYVPAYLSVLKNHLNELFPPKYWWPETPEIAFARQDGVIELCCHPRHWSRNRLATLGEDLTRVQQGIRYGLAARR